MLLQQTEGLPMWWPVQCPGVVPAWDCTAGQLKECWMSSLGCKSDLPERRGGNPQGSLVHIGAERTCGIICSLFLCFSLLTTLQKLVFYKLERQTII